MSRVTVLRSQLIDALRHPARMALVGVAIIIAAFVAFGTVLASRITERTILDGFSGTPAAVDFVIRDATMDTLEAVRAVSGVTEVAIRAVSFQTFADNPQQGLEVTADPGTGPLSLVTVLDGHYPRDEFEIAITERTVSRIHLAIGDTVRVIETGSAEPAALSLTVVGVVAAPDDFGWDAYATPEFAVRLAGTETLFRIDVATSSDISDALTAAIAGTGPDGADPMLQTGAEVRLEEVNQVSERNQSLFALIGMFVAVAVVAAILVAVSTFRIVFAQRMRQLALLRAVGAQRGAVLRALVVEGALTGLLAGVCGVMAATALAYLAPPVLSGFGVDIAAPAFPASAAVAVIIGATAATTLAVLAPAATASRVAPLEALRTASTTTGQRGINAGRWVLGILLGVGALAAAAAVVASLPDSDTSSYDAFATLLLIVGSGTLAYFALVALGPVLVRPVLAVAGWPLRRLSPIGRLAVGGVGAAPRRAAAVSVVVALGVTLMGGGLVGTASLRELVNRELAGMAPADLEVLPKEEVDTPLPDGVVDRARNLAELERVVPFRSTDDVTAAGLNADQIIAADLSLPALSTWEDFAAASGSLSELGPGRMVALSAYAEVAGWQPGQTIRVSRDGHTVEVQLAATLDNTPVGAGLLLDPSDLDRLGMAADPTALLADVAEDGESARTAALEALRSISGPEHSVAVLADQRDDLNREITMIMAVMLSLLGLTVIVSVVGVGTTTGLSVVERVREAGLLRAVGMSRTGLRTMLTVEAGLYGLIGSLLGLALAIPYAWLAVTALDVGAPVEFPAGQLVTIVLALSVATALAGLWPARRAARVSPVAALGAGS